MEQEPQTFYSASHALVVGINSYDDPLFMPLGMAEDDASSVASLLTTLRYGFQVSLLLGQQATRQAILGELFRLRRTNPDDRILVYFAGHGYTLTDLYGHETGYLAAADTVPEQDYTALELDEVTGLIRNAPAKHIAFIFDACFSGQALGLTRSPAVAAGKYVQRRAFQVISAGAGDQTVADFRSMTSTMIDALTSGRISRDGLATFSELGLYLQQEIAGDSRQTQIPQFGHLRGSQGGDFVFWTEEVAVELPRELREALDSSLTLVRRGAVEELVRLMGKDNPGLAAAARAELARMAEEDDSLSVRAMAREALGEIAPAPEVVLAQPVVPAEPVAVAPAVKPPPAKPRKARPTAAAPVTAAPKPQAARIAAAGEQTDRAAFLRRWWRVGVWLAGLAVFLLGALVLHSDLLIIAPGILCAGIIGVEHLIWRRWLRGGLHLLAALSWLLSFLSDVVGIYIEVIGVAYAAVLGTPLLIFWAIGDAIGDQVGEAPLLRRSARAGVGVAMALVAILDAFEASEVLTLLTLWISLLCAALGIDSARKRRWFSSAAFVLPALGWAAVWFKGFRDASELAYIGSYIPEAQLVLTMLVTVVAGGWLIVDAVRGGESERG